MFFWENSFGKMDGLRSVQLGFYWVRNRVMFSLAVHGVVGSHPSGIGFLEIEF